MGLVELLVSVTFVTLSVGVGFGMSNSTPGEFLFAKWCFVVSALVAIATYFYWINDGERTHFARITLGILVGLLVLPSLAEALSWLDGKQEATKKSASPATLQSHSPKQTPIQSQPSP